MIGSWTSTDFPFTTAPPATLPFPTGGFLIEFDPDAARLLHSTNVGGVFDVNGKGIAIDSSGNITLAGSTYGSFPITPGAFHAGDAGLYSPKAFVLKLAPSGQVIYSTFFGGTQAAPTPNAYENEHDYGVAVAVDAGGNAYVTGYTSAKDFPITPGVYQTSLAGGCSYPAFTNDTGFIGTISEWFVDDAFVVKLSPDGKTLLFSTFFGGSCYDHPTSIALDAYGQVYITGETDSTDFPLISDLEPGPPIREFVSFLSVFNPAASALMFSTYLYAGAAPTVVTGFGSLIHIAGSTGLGAQSQPDTGFINPFPVTATDGHLVLIKPARLRRRYRLLSDSGRARDEIR